jgi:hypothetical protein
MAKKVYHGFRGLHGFGKQKGTKNEDDVGGDGGVGAVGWGRDGARLGAEKVRGKTFI